MNPTRRKFLTATFLIGLIFEYSTAHGKEFYEPEMVVIKGGDFMMGSPESEPERDSDEYQNLVHVDDFAIAKTEVTKGQFQVFVTDTSYKTEAETGDGCHGWTDSGFSSEKNKKYNWRNVGFSQTDDHPVVCISWNDAMAYISWLNKKTGKTYSLPTEVQWEYAARAKTTTAYYWGNETTQSCRYANSADQKAKESLPSWFSFAECNDDFVFTSPVAHYQANGFGLYDMSGNVWEWMCNEYNERMARECAADETKNNAARAWRGGSWGVISRNLRSAARNGNTPDSRDIVIGFRLAL